MQVVHTLCRRRGALGTAQIAHELSAAESVGFSASPDVSIYVEQARLYSVHRSWKKPAPAA
jgi:hypothetical protein